MSTVEHLGQLITIEGVEGAGKSTQVTRLAEWLQGLGVPVTVTSEPDGTPLGVHLRRLLATVPPLDPLAECLLFAAARAEHVRRILRPALRQGRTVLCDRFGDSTIAYQGYGRGLDPDVIARLNRLVTDGLVPDLTIILDLDVGEGLRRASARRRGRTEAATEHPEPDPFEGLEVAFHERVRRGYRRLQEAEPARVVLVRADQPEEAVAAAIQAVVAPRLHLPVNQ